MKNKKNVFIIIGVIIFFIIGTIILFTTSDLNQEKKLKKELDYLYQVTKQDGYNTKEINKILERTATKGDYKKVEIAYKKYAKDCFTIVTDIQDVLSDTRLITVVSIENYQKDGKDFVETKEFLSSSRTKLQQAMIKYNEYLTESKAMSYLDKDLDEYYVNFYKDEVVGNLDNNEEDEELEAYINSIIDLINANEDVINFLIENKSNWNIENDTIVFENDPLKETYNDLISKLDEI